ncbi:MAG: hypothetical protein EXR75_04595, partial [Myxococcales bacterium]|nr:hypothetical protein [Myxococcales bacterium]
MRGLGDSGRVVAYFTAGLYALFGGCSVYGEDLLAPEGAGGAGGDTVCELPSDCPGVDTACVIRSCVAGICGAEFSPARASCKDGVGVVCDGKGTCVGCLEAGDCETRFCDASGSVPVCAECAFHSQCASSDFCDKSASNGCVPKLGGGAV